MTLTQILQKIRAAFYTRAEIDSMGGGASLDTTIRSKANASDLNNYLPLSGGQMTGAITVRNDSSLILCGGASTSDGPHLELLGPNWVNDTRGRFALVARNSEGERFLIGDPTGSLLWGTAELGYKDIDVVDSQGVDWIRYNNGIQICWGTVNIAWSPQEQQITISFAKSYKSNPSISLSHRRAGYTANSFSEIYNIFASKFTAIYVSADVTINPDGILFWQAIGYWK